GYVVTLAGQRAVSKGRLASCPRARVIRSKSRTATVWPKWAMKPEFAAAKGAGCPSHPVGPFRRIATALTCEPAQPRMELRALLSWRQDRNGTRGASQIRLHRMDKPIISYY